MSFLRYSERNSSAACSAFTAVMDQDPPKPEAKTNLPFLIYVMYFLDSSTKAIPGKMRTQVLESTKTFLLVFFPCFLSFPRITVPRTWHGSGETEERYYL